MKTIAILLAAAAITAGSALADDSWEIRELTRAVDANTAAVYQQGSHSGGGWMYQLMFGRENRRQESQRQEMFARWQAETEEALAKQQAEYKGDKQGALASPSQALILHPMTNDENHKRLVRGLLEDQASLLRQLDERDKKIAELEAENAYLETIKDPLRDNIGWSPISDLTFD